MKWTLPVVLALSVVVFGCRNKPAPVEEKTTPPEKTPSSSSSFTSRSRPSPPNVHGRITDEAGRPLRAHIELWRLPWNGSYSYRYSADESPTPTTAPSFDNEELVDAGSANEKGWFHLNAGYGDYLVRVCKGPEWEIREMKFSVSYRGEVPRIDVSLRRLYDLKPAGWYSGDVHHHSCYSDGLQTPAQVYEAALALDCDFLALSDHNTAAQSTEWLEYAGNGFLPIPACEITPYQSWRQRSDGVAFGHLGVLGLTTLANPKGTPESTYPSWRYEYESWDDVQGAIDKTHAAGGLFVLNHPMFFNLGGSDAINGWERIRDYDAIEIFNGGTVGPFMISLKPTGPVINYNTLATLIWFEMLSAGNRVSAVAGSDAHECNVAKRNPEGVSHWRPFTGNPRTYVRVRELTWPAVRTAIKRGNSFITSGYWGPLLLVESNGSGPGDEIRIRPGDQLPLHIEVKSNRPLKGAHDGIRIILGGKVVQELPTPEGQMSVSIDTRVKVDTTSDTWIVVQAFGEYPSAAMTNPIYLDVPPHDGWGAKEWTFPADAEYWCKPWPIAPQTTISDWPALPPPRKQPARSEEDPMDRRDEEPDGGSEEDSTGG